jgi:hypothetical protein
MQSFCKQCTAVAIPLAPTLPLASSNLPEQLETEASPPCGALFLFGLAPSGVYHATAYCYWPGALLPHHFTLTFESELSKAVYFLWHFP